MQLLDTDVAIDFFRKHEPAIQWLIKESNTHFALPGIVAMELLQGCRNKDEQRRVNKFLKKYDLVWPNQSDCGEAFRILNDFNLSHGIGLLDALIAATATGRNATLLTFNQKHYSPIAKLITNQPYAR